MAKIIDRRKIAMGGGDKRAVSNISKMPIHYSATATGHTASFERYWKNSRGWNTGGYHEVVLLNGDVELNYNPNVISNGVKWHNSQAYNICYVGSGQPNKAQRKSLVERIKYNKKRLGISDSQIKGHREFSRQSTACPAVNVADLVRESNGQNVNTSKPVVESIDKVINKPNKSKGDPTVTKIQNKVNRYYGVSIDVDGIAGVQTKRAVLNAYQQELRVQFGRNIVADGLAGRKTDAAAVRLYENNKYGDIAFLAQAMLYLQGYKITVDGYFGKKSTAVVVKFQRANGLKVDGKLGKATFKKLIRM